MEIARAYTNTLEILNQCNYIYSDQTNARDALLSCINQPKQVNPIDDNLCLNNTWFLKQVVILLINVINVIKFILM